MLSLPDRNGDSSSSSSSDEEVNRDERDTNVNRVAAPAADGKGSIAASATRSAENVSEKAE